MDKEKELREKMLEDILLREERDDFNMFLQRENIGSRNDYTSLLKQIFSANYSN